MSQYKFEQFQFNTENYQLTKNKIKHTVRPKTAMLLAYLIEHRHKIISKKELFKSVWLTEHVQDHTLFQVISEIRKLSKNELIRTQPNLGYQWVAATSEVKNTHQKAYLSIAASIICLASSTLFFTSNNQADIKNSNLPAITAYSKAVVALSNGDNQEAQKWLQFSLKENPESTETKLLLAESLFQQSNLTASESYAREVLNNKIASSYNYSMASDLLSRIYAQQGLVFDALQYAINGANVLKASQAVCSIAATDERIESLLKDINNSHNAQLQKNKIAESYYKNKMKKNESYQDNLSLDKLYTDMCDQVKKPIVHDKKAVCIPLKKSEFLLSKQIYPNNTMKSQVIV